MHIHRKLLTEYECLELNVITYDIRHSRSLNTQRDVVAEGCGEGGSVGVYNDK